MNVGYFYRKRGVLEGRREPEFYTLPREFIRTYHKMVASGFDRVHTKGVDLEPYKNDAGFELIAKAIGVEYPSR